MHSRHKLIKKNQDIEKSNNRVHCKLENTIAEINLTMERTQLEEEQLQQLCNDHDKLTLDLQKCIQCRDVTIKKNVVYELLRGDYLHDFMYACNVELYMYMVGLLLIPRFSAKILDL